MINKKIASEFAIGIILISAILISGIFLWKDRNNTLVVDKQILQMKEAGVLNQIVEQKDDSQNDTRENMQQVSAVIDKLCKKEMIGELHKCGKYFKSLPPAGLLDAPDNIYDVNGELIGFCGGMPGPDGPSNSSLCGLLCQGKNLCQTDAGQEEEGQVCTQEAKQCPDGSWVSRTGPKCEFAACK